LPEASARLLEHSGETRGEAFTAPSASSKQGGSRVLLSDAARGRRVQAGEEVEQSEPEAVPIESRPLPTVGLNASAADEALRLRGDPSPDDRLLADTRESAIAAYLDGWKRRIEQVGTLNFPNEARRRSLSGNPVLEVAIRADGRLEQVVVRRSSGHRELDAAAADIVRLASRSTPSRLPCASAIRCCVSRTSGSSSRAGWVTARCWPRSPEGLILRPWPRRSSPTSS